MRLPGLQLHDAVSEGDEDVLERRLDGFDLRLRKLRAKDGKMIGLCQCVNGAPEDGGLAKCRYAAHAVQNS